MINERGGWVIDEYDPGETRDEEGPGGLIKLVIVGTSLFDDRRSHSKSVLAFYNGYDLKRDAAWEDFELMIAVGV